MSVNLMNRPGPCIQLTKNTGKAYEQKDFILPLEGPVGITTTQELIKPIEKLYKYVEDAIIGVAGDLGGGTGSAVARSLLEVSNLTGIQVGSKGFHAQAWAGAQPSQFTIVAKFNRGMAGKWSSEKEVYTPARQLYALSLPFEESSFPGVVFSPVPSPLMVFETFSAQIIKSAVSAIGLITNAATGGTFQADIGGVTKDAQSTIDITTNFLGKVTGQSPELWEVDFGYYEGGGNEITKFLSLPRLIVQTSGIKFGTMRERVMAGVFYPTTAEVTLSFVSEDFLTSANFSSPLSQQNQKNQLAVGN